MTTATEAARSAEPVIDPAEWDALLSFSYDGVTYGRGEPVPVMPLATAEAYVLRGQMARRVPIIEVDTIKSPEDYLRGPDHLVLNGLLKQPPTLDQLQRIAALARQQGRSMVLCEALALAISLKQP